MKKVRDATARILDHTTLGDVNGKSGESGGGLQGHLDVDHENDRGTNDHVSVRNVLLLSLHQPLRARRFLSVIES